MRDLLLALLGMAAIAFLRVSSAIGGVIVAYKSLEYSETRKVEDGKERTLLTLWIGPFAYRIEIPKKIPHETHPPTL